VICSAGDVVVVPFPFVDVDAERRRPSVVLSHATFNRTSRHTVCAMITTGTRSNWTGDIEIRDLATAGLRRTCVVRWKVFTLPNENILARLGSLGVADHAAVVQAGRSILL